MSAPIATTHSSPAARQALVERARRARQLRVGAARKDPAYFCEFVLRDEKTGKPIKLTSHHVEMIRALWTNDFCVVWSHVEFGKTNLALGLILFMLGSDPTLKIAIISNTSGMAEKTLRQIRQYIEHSAELREVFPNLRLSSNRALPNNTRALTVERPKISAKDPSIQATGLHGNILGSRIDHILLDDALDYESTRTQAPRDDSYNWLTSGQCFGRLQNEGRIWAVTNAWHPEDAMERLVAENGFAHRRFPVLDADGCSTWPERWPPKRIELYKTTILGPLEFARAMMAKPRADEDRRIRPEWIEWCKERGVGATMIESLAELGLWGGASAAERLLAEAYGRDGLAGIEEFIAQQDPESEDGIAGIVHGLDTAVQKHSAADMTSLFTTLVFRNGDRRLLRIRTGRMSAPEIMQLVTDAYKAFGGVFIVENVASQEHLRVLMSTVHGVPTRPYTTGPSIAHPEHGIEQLALEFFNRKWIVPSRRVDGGALSVEPEVAAWARESVNYDPLAHPGDRLMASFFSRVGALKLFGVHAPGLGAYDGGARVTTFAEPEQERVRRIGGRVRRAQQLPESVEG